jgi:hypothetical protein
VSIAIVPNGTSETDANSVLTTIESLSPASLEGLFLDEMPAQTTPAAVSMRVSTPQINSMPSDVVTQLSALSPLSELAAAEETMIVTTPPATSTTLNGSSNATTSLLGSGTWDAELPADSMQGEEDEGLPFIQMAFFSMMPFAFCMLCFMCNKYNKYNKLRATDVLTNERSDWKNCIDTFAHEDVMEGIDDKMLSDYISKQAAETRRHVLKSNLGHDAKPGSGDLTQSGNPTQSGSVQPEHHKTVKEIAEEFRSVPRRQAQALDAQRAEARKHRCVRFTVCLEKMFCRRKKKVKKKRAPTITFVGNADDEEDEEPEIAADDDPYANVLDNQEEEESGSEGADFEIKSDSEDEGEKVVVHKTMEEIEAERQAEEDLEQQLEHHRLTHEELRALADVRETRMERLVHNLADLRKLGTAEVADKAMVKLQQNPVTGPTANFIFHALNLHSSAEMEEAAEKEEWIFVQYDGCIFKHDDLHRERLTLQEAKQKCRHLVGIKGFCLRGVPSKNPLDKYDIHFKDEWQLDTSMGKKKWTSYQVIQKLKVEDTEEGAEGPVPDHDDEEEHHHHRARAQIPPQVMWEGRHFGDKIVVQGTLFMDNGINAHGHWISEDRFMCHINEGTFVCHFQDQAVQTYWMPGKIEHKDCLHCEKLFDFSGNDGVFHAECPYNHRDFFDFRGNETLRPVWEHAAAFYDHRMEQKIKAAREAHNTGSSKDNHAGNAVKLHKDIHIDYEKLVSIETVTTLFKAPNRSHVILKGQKKSGNEVEDDDLEDDFDADEADNAWHPHHDKEHHHHDHHHHHEKETHHEKLDEDEQAEEETLVTESSLVASSSTVHTNDEEQQGHHAEHHKHGRHSKTPSPAKGGGFKDLAEEEVKHEMSPEVIAAVEKAKASPLYHDLSEKHRSQAAKEHMGLNDDGDGMLGNMFEAFENIVEGEDGDAKPGNAAGLGGSLWGWISGGGGKDP